MRLGEIVPLPGRYWTPWTNDPLNSPRSPTNIEHPFPFLRLPYEIQVLVFRHYFRAWNFSIHIFLNGRGIHQLTRNEDPPEQPHWFHVRSAGCEGARELCALWTSPDIYEPAKEALVYSFVGELCFSATYDSPSRFKPLLVPSKPFLDYFIPRFPAHLIRTIRFDTSEQYESSPHFRGSHKTWHHLIHYIDCEQLPRLRVLRLRTHATGYFNFRVSQIGQFLRGEFDDAIENWMRIHLPRFHRWEEHKMHLLNSDKARVQITVVSNLKYWVPTWDPYPGHEINSKEAARIIARFEGGLSQNYRLKEIKVISDDFRAGNGCLAQRMEAHGSDWEAKAAARWPGIQLDHDITDHEPVKWSLHPVSEDRWASLRQSHPVAHLRIAIHVK